MDDPLYVCLLSLHLANNLHSLNVFFGTNHKKHFFNCYTKNTNLKRKNSIMKHSYNLFSGVTRLSNDKDGNGMSFFRSF